VVDAFVKNAGLGLAIPYLHNGQSHDYMPDFIVRLRSDPPLLLVLETKGFDPVADIKASAAQRWVAAVNADGLYGRWAYAVARRVADVHSILADLTTGAAR
jgi:type III restriction enzyme